MYKTISIYYVFTKSPNLLISTIYKKIRLKVVMNIYKEIVFGSGGDAKGGMFYFGGYIQTLVQKCVGCSNA